MEEILLPLLPAGWRGDILNFTLHEFENRIREDGKVRLLDGDIPEKYNQDRYSPVDGRVLKGCDHLAAFLEAWLSSAASLLPIWPEWWKSCRRPTKGKSSEASTSGRSMPSSGKGNAARQCAALSFYYGGNKHTINCGNFSLK